MLQFVLFAVTAILVLIGAVIFLMPSSKKITTVPGPMPVDELEGNFPDIQAAGSLYEFLYEIHKTYGPIASLWWGPRLAISIASPELFKQQINVFDRPACLFELFKPLIGEDSIQLANGPEARRRHAAYARCFSSSVISQYYKVFNKLSKELVEKWRSLPKDSHIPVTSYMLAFSTKAVLQASFGSYFKNDKPIHQVKQAYEFIYWEMENRLRGGITEASRESLNRFDQHYEALKRIVEESLEHRRNNPPVDGEHLVIDAILEMDDSSVQLCDAFTVLVASIHTSGYVLAWALYFLASHQDVQDHVYEEVMMVLGDNEVDSVNFNDLKYLSQVVSETLRCSVVAPYAARVQDVETELGGHHIPAGTPVIQALGVVYKDPEIFPDPDRFDPDRFSDEKKQSLPKLSFEPFGFAGKRVCPGYRFALSEITILLARIVRSFKVKLIEGQVVIPEHGLVTKPKEEIWITLSERK